MPFRFACPSLCAKSRSPVHVCVLTESGGCERGWCCRPWLRSTCPSLDAMLTRFLCLRKYFAPVVSGYHRVCLEVGTKKLPSPWYCWKYCLQDLKTYGTTFKPGESTRPDDPRAMIRVDGQETLSNAGNAMGGSGGEVRRRSNAGGGCADRGSSAPGYFVCAHVYDQTNNKCHKITGKDFLQDFQKELASFIASSSAESCH